MVFGAIIGAITGSISQSQELDRQEDIARDRLEYDRAIYDWQNTVANTQYEYDVMRTNALREAEAQAAGDYVEYQRKLIDQAVQNYSINSKALIDQFVTGENIRSQQETTLFNQRQGTFRQNLVEQMRQGVVRQDQARLQGQGDTYREVGAQQLLGLRAAEVSRQASYEANQSALDMVEQVRQYANQTNQLAARSNLQRTNLERETSELLGTLALEEQADYFGWQLESIAAMARDGQIGARAMGGQGAGTTSKRLAIESAQALGRTWAQQTVRARGRDLRVRVASEAFSKGLAAQFAQTTLEMEDLGARAAYEVQSRTARQKNIVGAAGEQLEQTRIQSGLSRDIYGVAMRGNQLSFDDAMGAMRFALTSTKRDAKADQDLMRQVTIPGFKLARRQGKRELQSLFLQTQSVFDRASIPYRPTLYFDPVAPIPGPSPERSGTANFSSPGFGTILAGNLASGAANQLATSISNGTLFGGNRNLFPTSGSAGFNPAAFTGGMNFGISGLSGATDFSSSFGGGASTSFNPGAFSMDLGF